MDTEKESNIKYEENKCDLCRRYSPFLIPKYSNKKGYKGWKMVCRICYDRLLEDDKHTSNK